jgi:broad specificity phosphatase PhoE
MAVAKTKPTSPLHSSPVFFGYLSMRLLLIRHAESAENVAMHMAIEKLIRGEIAADQLGEVAEVAMLEIVPANGDSPLSEKGQEQARKLGEYWSPVLDGRAGHGGVHFYVSPQIRCMRTATPLITPLFEKYGIKAQVLPDLIEIPGLMQKGDSTAFFPEYERLLSEGKKVEASAFRKAFKWKACGENVEDMQREFPWAVFDHKLFPETGPWYDKGWESIAEARERAGRNAALLRSLQHKLRDGEVVVFVSHGAAMGTLLSSLLGTDVSKHQSWMTWWMTHAHFLLSRPNPIIFHSIPHAG